MRHSHVPPCPRARLNSLILLLPARPHIPFPLGYTAAMNIVLIGYRGSGKSSVGKKLASKLWLDFVDSDALIIERAGMTIREIFEKEGEAGFREREVAVIQELAGRDNLVIAAGGGAVLDPTNVEALKKNGKIIWLHAEPDVLHERIQADTETNATRPNLTSAGGLEEIKDVLAQRMTIYKSAAHVRLDVTHLSVDEDRPFRLVSLI